MVPPVDFLWGVNRPPKFRRKAGDRTKQLQVVGMAAMHAGIAGTGKR